MRGRGVAGCCENGMNLLVSYISENFVDWLRNCQLVNKDCATLMLVKSLFECLVQWTSSVGLDLLTAAGEQPCAQPRN
jgi:hypothetical protein